jgi:hypothetical protein
VGKEPLALVAVRLGPSAHSRRPQAAATATTAHSAHPPLLWKAKAMQATAAAATSRPPVQRRPALHIVKAGLQLRCGRAFGKATGKFLELGQAGSVDSSWRDLDDPGAEGSLPGGGGDDFPQRDERLEMVDAESRGGPSHRLAHAEGAGARAELERAHPVAASDMAIRRMGSSSVSSATDPGLAWAPGSRPACGKPGQRRLDEPGAQPRADLAAQGRTPGTGMTRAVADGPRSPDQPANAPEQARSTHDSLARWGEPSPYAGGA